MDNLPGESQLGVWEGVVSLANNLNLDRHVDLSWVSLSNRKRPHPVKGRGVIVRCDYCKWLTFTRLRTRRKACVWWLSASHW